MHLALTCTWRPAGFPIRTRVLPALPGYVVRQAQGVVGGDFPCNQSIVPGICAFSAAINAGAACSNSLADQCNSVMVYENGTDGCSSQVAVLKTANLAPSNSFMAPTTYVLEKVDGAPVSLCWRPPNVAREAGLGEETGHAGVAALST